MEKIGRKWEKRMNLLQRTPSSMSFWQYPRHLDGIGPIPSSLKLFDSGQTPIHNPITAKICQNTIAIDKQTVAHILICKAKRRQKHECIVKNYLLLTLPLSDWYMFNIWSHIYRLTKSWSFKQIYCKSCFWSICISFNTKITMTPGNWSNNNTGTSRIS